MKLKGGRMQRLRKDRDARNNGQRIEWDKEKLDDEHGGDER